MNIKQTIEQTLHPYTSIGVWGSGGLGRTAIQRWLPSEKIRYIIDSYSNSQSLAGKPIMRPDHVDFSSLDCIVVCSTAYLKIKEQLARSSFRGKVIYIYELLLPSSPMNQIDMLRIDILATKNEALLPFLLKKPQILVNITYRLCRWAKYDKSSRLLSALFFLLHSFVTVLLSIQLPIETDIGPGLVFAHFGTIVFTARAKIGAFFTIYHGCTVGTNDTGKGPIIENFVTQFAGSHVLGRCHIGSFTRIGANAVVLDAQCPQGNCSLVGIPAKIHSTEHPSREETVL